MLQHDVTKESAVADVGRGRASGASVTRLRSDVMHPNVPN